MMNRRALFVASFALILVLLTPGAFGISQNMIVHTSSPGCAPFIQPTATIRFAANQTEVDSLGHVGQYEVVWTLSDVIHNYSARVILQENNGVKHLMTIFYRNGTGTVLGTSLIHGTSSDGYHAPARPFISGDTMAFYLTPFDSKQQLISFFWYGKPTSSAKLIIMAGATAPFPVNFLPTEMSLLFQPLNPWSTIFFTGVQVFVQLGETPGVKGSVPVQAPINIQCSTMIVPSLSNICEDLVYVLPSVAVAHWDSGN